MQMVKKNVQTDVLIVGCGVGGCLVCVCRTIRDGEEYYAHVCKDGPVFEAEEVLFDD